MQPKKFGYTIRLFINRDPKMEEDLWGEVIASSVDGILFMNDEMTKDIYRQIEYTPVPVVFVNTLSQKIQSVVYVLIMKIVPTRLLKK